LIFQLTNGLLLSKTDRKCFIYVIIPSPPSRQFRHSFFHPHYFQRFPFPPYHPSFLFFQLQFHRRLPIPLFKLSEILSDSQPKILSHVRFTSKQRFCCFSPILLPCKIHIQNLNLPIRSPLVPYVGIDNLATTCYAASALQFILTASPFVELIFKTHCDKDTVCFHLQKVFSDLLFSDFRVQIRQFVLSFGSKSQELVTEEQDSHEFLLSLFDRLDHEIGKEFEAHRNEFFSVLSERIVECKEADITKKTEETSNEIQLPVEGVSSIDQALSIITEREILDGANKWDTETDRGKLPAERYLRYKSLPPFLMFNLGRYTFKNDRADEVRSFLDCPEDLDMKKYMIEDIDQCTKYKIAAVVAHRGNVGSGHYVTFCKRGNNDRWFQFNDSVVQPSSFSEVHATFGFKETLFTKLIGLITSGRFVAYLVGYIREDCIESFRYIDVPFAISPHGSTQYCARLIHYRQIVGPRVYGYGKEIDWDDKEKTVSQLFDDETDLAFFVSPPDHYDGFYGPIDPNSSAVNWLVSGFRVNFIAVPDGIESPVFFIANGEFRGVFDKTQIVEQFESEFEFRVQGFPITDFKTVSNGAVVFGVPLTSVTLEIDNKSVIVPRVALYADVQKIISPSSPSKVLFCDENKNSLHRRHFPTALQLSQKNPLISRILTGIVTFNSLDLFNPLTIDFYDSNHRKTTQSFLWFQKGRTVRDLTSELPRWFNFKPDSSPHYVVSPAVARTELISRILQDDTVITSTHLRVDFLTCPLPKSCREIRDLFDITNALITTIEVQAMTHDSGSVGWPVFSTIGFFTVNKSTTANSLARSTGKTVAKFFIKAAHSFQTVTIEGKDPLFRLFQQLGDEGSLGDERPVLILQIGKPTKK
jgi:ubiquitin C-terminal hydrolase